MMTINPQHLAARCTRLASTTVRILLLPVAVLATMAVISAPVSAADMTIEVTRPTNGAVVPRRFTVHIATNVAIGPPDTGRHHIHLYWDGQRDDGKYDIVYKKSFTKKGLSPGVHHLDAVIANADHSTTSTHEKLKVTVRSGGGGGSPTPAPTPTNGQTGSGY